MSLRDNKTISNGMRKKKERRAAPYFAPHFLLPGSSLFKKVGLSPPRKVYVIFQPMVNRQDKKNLLPI
jgi:hypothetical protein